MEAEFNTIRRHSSSDACPGLRAANRLAASIPGGVAALPSPRKLAQILVLKAPARALSSRVEGNSRCITGRSSRESFSVSPNLSMARPIPAQRHSDPAMEIARVTPLCAPCITAAESADARPLTAAQTTEAQTSAAHTQLITIKNPPAEDYAAGILFIRSHPGRRRTPRSWEAPAPAPSA